MAENRCGDREDVDPRDATLLAALDRGEFVREPTTREEMEPPRQYAA